MMWLTAGRCCECGTLRGTRVAVFSQIGFCSRRGCTVGLASSAIVIEGLVVLLPFNRYPARHCLVSTESVALTAAGV